MLSPRPCSNPWPAIRPEVPWYGFVRVHPGLADANFCHALRKSGCVLLKLGLESGNQDILDSMHKGIELELVARVLTALQDAGIATYVYLLFGTPGGIDWSRPVILLTLPHNTPPLYSYLNLAIFNMPDHQPGSRRAGAFRLFRGRSVPLYRFCPSPRLESSGHPPLP